MIKKKERKQNEESENLCNSKSAHSILEAKKGNDEKINEGGRTRNAKDKRK